jgi:hypothetical protein
MFKLRDFYGGAGGFLQPNNTAQQGKSTSAYRRAAIQKRVSA